MTDEELSKEQMESISRQLSEIDKKVKYLKSREDELTEFQRETVNVFDEFLDCFRVDGAKK